MRGGRRQTGLARVLAVGMTGLILCRAANAQGGFPAAAVAQPTARFEGYPDVGAAQGAEIAREVVGSSVRSLVRAPLRSTRRIVGRTVEQLSLRGSGVSMRLASLRTEGANEGGFDLAGCAGGPPVPARLTLLPSSELSIQGLLRQIATAARRIDLMMYGWEDDPTGRRVAEALTASAARGVRVRLLVDRGGFLIHNAAAAEGGCTFLDGLRRVPNVSVIEPENPFLCFDHRKLALIDGRIAWSGGMILTEVARRDWQNVAFLAEGPIVASYAALFEERWREVGGSPEGPLWSEPWLPPDAANASVRLIQTDLGERSFKKSLYHAVDHARRHVYFANPYVSDGTLIDKLVAAKARGVDVRAIMTVQSNVRVINEYSTVMVNRLLEGGVRVYLFPGMTHVKAMSADGNWAYVGTGNFDELSLRNNREVGLSITSPWIVRDLDRSVFVTHMSASREATEPLPVPRNMMMLKLLSIYF